MATLVGSDGSLFGVGGGNQPFPRSSVPLSDYAGGVDLLGDLTVSFAHIYRTQIWVAIVVNKIAYQISRLPLKAYKRTSEGRSRLRTGVLPGLLERPFARSGPTHLKQAMMKPALVHGNSALRIVRDRPDGPPASFAPLLWRRLTAHADDGGPVEIWETSQAGHPRWIPPGDIIHLAWRGLDGPIGLSPLRQLGVTLAIEDAAQRHQRAMLANSAAPAAAISMSEQYIGMERGQRDEIIGNLRSDVDRLYAGPENTGRPILLPPGLEWKSAAHTAVEAELISQRELTREECAACYDMPPPLIGILEHATLSNLTEMHRMLYVTILGPWLTLIEETLQAQLITPEPALRGDVWVEFDLSEVLKGDTLQRAQALALQIGYGLLTIDEGRELENRPRFDLPETSLPLYPANNLRPAGMAAVAPSDASVQDAAKAVAAMDSDQVVRLLASSGGSVVDAILKVAALPDPEVALNGHVPLDAPLP